MKQRDADDLHQIKEQCWKRLRADPTGNDRAPARCTNVWDLKRLASHNVFGVGVGPKQVNGRTTRRNAVQFYVYEKFPQALLPAKSRLPRELDGYPTDVIVDEPPVLLGSLPRSRSGSRRDCRPRVRPLRPGASTAHVNVLGGTLGAFCRMAGDDRVYAISNNHVFANLHRGRILDEITQPARCTAQPVAEDVVGELADRIPLRVGTGENQIDAALARLKPSAFFDPDRIVASVPEIGRIRGTGTVSRRERVRKFGSGTGLTTKGKVNSASWDGEVLIDPRDRSKKANFTDVIRIGGRGRFADAGDSGSLVFKRDENIVVGLLFAASRSSAVACKIDGVLSNQRWRVSLM